MNKRNKLLSSALFILACGLGFVSAGADAFAAPAATTSVEVVAQAVDATGVDVEGETHCEDLEGAAPEAMNSGLVCRFTCQMEYSLCQTGGGSNCTSHYNQCLSECAQLPG